MAPIISGALSCSIITSESVTAGFMRLAHGVADLTLDVPLAPNLIAGVVARAIKDNVLPPDFAANLVSLDSVELDQRQTSAKSQVGLLAKAKLKLNSQRQRRASVGEAFSVGHELRRVELLKAAVTAIITEYKVTAEMKEAAHAVWALDSPFFHHEVVKQIVTLAYDSSREEQHNLQLLFQAMISSGLISQEQASQGLDRCLQQLEDSELDSPGAAGVLGTFCESARRYDALAAPLAASLPASLVAQSPPAAELRAVTMGNSTQCHCPGALQAATNALTSLKDPALGSVACTGVLLSVSGAPMQFVSLALRLDAWGPRLEAIDVLAELANAGAVSTQEFECVFCHALTRELQLQDAAHGEWIARCLAELVSARVLSPLSVSTISTACEAAGSGEEVISVLERSKKLWKAKKTFAAGLRRAQRHATRGAVQVQQEISNQVAGLASGDAIDLVAQRLAQMNTPYMAPEIVVAIFRLHLEKTDAVLAVCVLFITSMCANGLLSQNQLSCGIKKVVESEAAAIPNAQLISALLKEGAISKSQLPELPESVTSCMSMPSSSCSSSQASSPTQSGCSPPGMMPSE